MRYRRKIINLPSGMTVGAAVRVIGDGLTEYRISSVDYNEDGTVRAVHLDCGWNEPICKIYLPNGYSPSTNRENFADVRIGECDFCSHYFPDSCSFYQMPGSNESMVCSKCWQKHRTSLDKS